MSNKQDMQTLKGFRDFIGPEAKKRQWLMGIMRSVFERFGFEPLETPTLEYEALLLGKYGTEAEKLIYRFEDNGGRKVAMRYDQTVPTARIISQYQNQLTFPYKRYQIQPVWRADKPQKGRYREFYQSDCDVIGSTSIVADAEVLAVYFALYNELGLSSIQLKINDRSQLIDIIRSQGVEESNIFSVIQTIDKLDKQSKDELVAELALKNVPDGMALFDALLQSTPSSELTEIMNLAESLGVPKSALVFSPTLARGLDYYTGMIFEGIIPEYTVGSVGGGGRYDNLINDLVGVQMPAVGFGIGFDRTLEAAEQLGVIPTDTSALRVLVTVFSPSMVSCSLETTAALRSNQIAAECYPDSAAKIDKQLKYANKRAIPFVIVIGPDEADKNLVMLKDMNAQSQEALTIDQAVTKISSYAGK